MNRPVTAVFAALESLLVVGIGVGVPVVALTFLWAFQYGLQIDWLVFWRAGVDVWLVGHGVDLSLALSKAAASATGIAGADAPIVLSMAALGFAVVTILLGARAGRRIAETPHRLVGSATAVGVFAVLSAAVTVSARQPLAEPSLWQGIVWPTLIFTVPLVITAEVNRRRRELPADPVTSRILAALDRLPAVGRTVAFAALRSGTIVAVAVLAFGGLVVALLLLTHYAAIISLFEGAHAGALGGLALTIGQVALIPNAIAWTASWFVGPGFALGTGSSVSPLGTSIGPLPAVPFLGALPTSQLTFGFVGILVPVVAAFVVATLLRPRLEQALGRDDSVTTRVITGVAAGVVAGLLLGFVAAVSAGSAGPGRLAEVGPHALIVGSVAALEVALPAVLALVVSQRKWASRDMPTGGRSERDLRERLSSVAGRLPGKPSRATRVSGGAEPTDEQATEVIEPLDRDPAPSSPKSAPGPHDVATERLDGFRR